MSVGERVKNLPVPEEERADSKSESEFYTITPSLGEENLMRTNAIFGLLAVALVPALLTAQASPQDQQKAMEAYAKAAAVTANHDVLKMFTGHWDATATMWMMPGAPPSTSKNTVDGTPMMGGRFVRLDYKGTMMGQPFEGMQITGYDNIKKTYTTFWIDNSSTSFYLLEGPYDPAKKAFVQTGQWADPMGGTTPVRAVITIVGPNEYLYENYMTLPDGKEFKSLEYRAIKQK